MHTSAVTSPGRRGRGFGRPPVASNQKEMAPLIRGVLCASAATSSPTAMKSHAQQRWQFGQVVDLVVGGVVRAALPGVPVHPNAAADPEPLGRHDVVLPALRYVGHFL